MKDEPITEELPKITEGYKPPVPGEIIQVEFPLEDEDIDFIDSIAEKHDISFQTALNIVWRDAFRLLLMSKCMGEKYVNSKKSRVDG